jgi:hypothetical protein
MAIWKLLKNTWALGLAWRQSQQVTNTRSRITICGQKWLGPGESLRIVEVELDGATHRLALWNTKGSSQMLQLAEAEKAARAAAC